MAHNSSAEHPSHDDLGASPSPAAYLDQLKDFFLAALSFRQALIEARDGDKEQLVSILLHLLPLLYQKGYALPSDPESLGITEDSLAEVYLPEFVTEEEYTFVANSLETLLGNDDYFLETTGEEMQYTDAPITSRLSEYLADLFQPVCNLLLTAKHRDYIALPYAVIHCQRLFAEYWGDRLLAALRALHQIRFRKDDEGEPPLVNPSCKPLEDRIQGGIEAFFQENYPNED